MEAIAAAWSEYKKLEVQKPVIKAANISTFLLITLAILFAGRLPLAPEHQGSLLVPASLATVLTGFLELMDEEDEERLAQAAVRDAGALDEADVGGVARGVVRDARDVKGRVSPR